jgi:hypothetical protein
MGKGLLEIGDNFTGILLGVLTYKIQPGPRRWWVGWWSSNFVKYFFYLFLNMFVK